MMKSASPRWPWLPYVGPMATFLLLSSVEGYLPRSGDGPHPVYYPVFYTIKILLVVVAIGFGRAALRDLSPWPGWKSIGLAVSLGLLVTALWVGLDGILVYAGAGKRAEFNPGVLPVSSRWAFLAVRLLGLVVVVPLFEELFWRSFVVRWIIDPDKFQAVPIGRVTPIAAAVTAGLFAVEHPAEWLPALLTGALWGWLLHASKSVSACFISHAVANLGLGIYVLTTGSWKFW